MSLKDKVPDYLLEKENLVTTVMFTALFSVALVICTMHFSGNVWFQLGPDKVFALTLAFFLLSLAVVSFSKKMLYGMRHVLGFTYLQYIVWAAAEVFVISLLYSTFTVYADYKGVIDIAGRPFADIFFYCLLYMAVSLGVPYVLCGQYFALNDKDNTIRLLNLGNVVTDQNVTEREEKKITLFDNNGVLKFSISADNLYYIESDDNYIQVWYKDMSGEKKQYMLRCRLKTVEDSFEDSDLLRCHRKYIVNMSKVKILKAEKDGYEITLDLEEVEPIPVSKTYETAVLARFNSMR